MRSVYPCIKTKIPRLFRIPDHGVTKLRSYGSRAPDLDMLR